MHCLGVTILFLNLFCCFHFQSSLDALDCYTLQSHCCSVLRRVWTLSNLAGHRRQLLRLHRHLHIDIKNGKVRFRFPCTAGFVEPSTSLQIMVPLHTSALEVEKCLEVLETKQSYFDFVLAIWNPRLWQGPCANRHNDSKCMVWVKSSLWFLWGCYVARNRSQVPNSSFPWLSSYFRVWLSNKRANW